MDSFYLFKLKGFPFKIYLFVLRRCCNEENSNKTKNEVFDIKS